MRRRDWSGLAKGAQRGGEDLLPGALGLAVISAVVTSHTRGTGPAALTAGFHAGFVVSAALVAVTAPWPCSATLLDER